LFGGCAINNGERRVPQAGWDSRNGLTRRTWLQSSAAAGISLLTLSDLAAQDEGFREALRRMSLMTGAPLPASREATVALLVSIILDYSKSLRALDLGEVEPAPRFVPR